VLDEAINSPGVKPPACILRQRPPQRCELIAGRIMIGRLGGRAAMAATKSAATACRSRHDPLYIPLHIRHDRKPKGVVARQMRSSGRAEMADVSISMASNPAKSGVLLRHRWVVITLHRPMRRCFHGATSIMYEGKPIGTPDGRRVLARHLEQQRGGVLHLSNARSRSGGDPNAIIRKDDLGEIPHLFLAGERADPATL